MTAPEEQKKSALPGLHSSALYRLMERLEIPCSYCGAKSWMYVETVDIRTEEYLRYVCQHCSETYRAIPLDYLRTGDDRKIWER